MCAGGLLRSSLSRRSTLHGSTCDTKVAPWTGGVFWDGTEIIQPREPYLHIWFQLEENKREQTNERSERRTRPIKLFLGKHENENGFLAWLHLLDSHISLVFLRQDNLTIRKTYNITCYLMTVPPRLICASYTSNNLKSNALWEAAPSLL